MRQKRLSADVRRDVILSAACRLAVRGTPYRELTREQIAQAVGVTGTAVQYHFQTIDAVRRDMMEHAIRYQVLGVIAQGLVAGDPLALGAPEELKKQAVENILK